MDGPGDVGGFGVDTTLILHMEYYIFICAENGNANITEINVFRLWTWPTVSSKSCLKKLLHRFETDAIAAVKYTLETCTATVFLCIINMLTQLKTSSCSLQTKFYSRCRFYFCFIIPDFTKRTFLILFVIRISEERVYA